MFFVFVVVKTFFNHLFFYEYLHHSKPFFKLWYEKIIILVSYSVATLVEKKQNPSLYKTGDMK